MLRAAPSGSAWRVMHLQVDDGSWRVWLDVMTAFHAADLLGRLRLDITQSASGFTA